MGEAFHVEMAHSKEALNYVDQFLSAFGKEASRSLVKKYEGLINLK